jgi:hypothetical protein
VTVFGSGRVIDYTGEDGRLGWHVVFNTGLAFDVEPARGRTAADIAIDPTPEHRLITERHRALAAGVPHLSWVATEQHLIALEPAGRMGRGGCLVLSEVRDIGGGTLVYGFWNGPQLRLAIAHVRRHLQTLWAQLTNFKELRRCDLAIILPTPDLELPLMTDGTEPTVQGGLAGQNLERITDNLRALAEAGNQIPDEALEAIRRAVGLPNAPEAAVSETARRQVQVLAASISNEVRIPREVMEAEVRRQVGGLSELVMRQSRQALEQMVYSLTFTSDGNGGIVVPRQADEVSTFFNSGTLTNAPADWGRQAVPPIEEIVAEAERLRERFAPQAQGLPAPLPPRTAAEASARGLPPPPPQRPVATATRSAPAGATTQVTTPAVDPVAEARKRALFDVLKDTAAMLGLSEKEMAATYTVHPDYTTNTYELRTGGKVALRGKLPKLEKEKGRFELLELYDLDEKPKAEAPPEPVVADRPIELDLPCAGAPGEMARCAQHPDLPALSIGRDYVCPVTQQPIYISLLDLG